MIPNQPTRSSGLELSRVTPALAEFSSEPPEGLLPMPALVPLLARSRRLIVLSSFAAMVLAAIFAFALPPMYTCSTSLLPPGSSDSSSDSALMGARPTGGGSLLEIRRQGNFLVGLLQSESISRDVVGRLNLMQVYNVKRESEAEKKLLFRSSFEIGVKAPIVTISVMDRSPQRARDLAAAYLDALQQTSNGLAHSESSERRHYYEQRLDQEKAGLARAEAALKQTEQKTGFVAPAGQVDLNIQAQALLQGQITSLEAQLAALLQSETDENADVLRLREEIGSLRARATQMESGTGGLFGTLSTARIPEAEMEYDRNLREVNYHEVLLDTIAKQYESAGLDQAKDSPLQVLDQPLVPDSKSGPKRSLIMALGLLLGLLASSSWVMFQAARGWTAAQP